MNDYLLYLLPKILSSLNNFIKGSNFKLKILVRIYGRLDGSRPLLAQKRLICGHVGLHVKVRKRSGKPAQVQIDIASL